MATEAPGPLATMDDGETTMGKAVPRMPPNPFQVNRICGTTEISPYRQAIRQRVPAAALARSAMVLPARARWNSASSSNGPVNGRAAAGEEPFLAECLPTSNRVNEGPPFGLVPHVGEDRAVAK